MSDFIKHECGLGMVRLLKPIEYYAEKYGTPLYGLNKLDLLMQKIRNRGQDGAGVATIKFDMQEGQRYISRHRSKDRSAMQDVFQHIYTYFKDVPDDLMNDVQRLKVEKPFIGELMMGHLRYGTHGENSIESVHPFLRQSNWITRNLVVAGNFNLTNVRDLFSQLVELGQHPKELSDTVTVMEKIGHFLDDEVNRIHTWFKPEGYSNYEITQKIIEALDVPRLLRRAARKFDGGFTIGGMIGHGDAFVMRDPNGIRPAFWYKDDEFVVVCSERPAIQTAFNVRWKKVKEIQPGHALIIRRNGEVFEAPYTDTDRPHRPCSFERIYFSRGTDRKIYLERKQLGRNLAKQIMKKVGHDFDHTVFSFVPNTAETAYLGLVEEAEELLNKQKRKRVRELSKKGKLTEKSLAKTLQSTVRREKLIIKDEKLRTFIADDSMRGNMVHYGYDVTYGIVENYEDTIVIMDDSIVRGTTMRDSIVSILNRLHPKRIIIVSSAPQIRYPDCYGIDMSKLGNFVAFQALINLLKRDKKEKALKKAYQRAKASLDQPVEDIQNELKPLYDRYPYEEISNEIARIITPKDLDIPVEVVYQTLDGLHKALGDNTGDWYFSGNYPTPGGMRVVNKAFVNYMDGKNERAY